MSCTETDLPRIAYTNAIASAHTLIASSTADGFDVNNIYDWKDSTFWRPDTTGPHTIEAQFSSATGVNYFAIHGHNMGVNSGTIKLQYDNGSGWTDATATITPIGTEVIYVTFDEILSSLWRVYITGPEMSFAVIAFGHDLEIPLGVLNDFSPPPYNRNTKTQVNISELGNFLGDTVIYNGVKIGIIFEWITIDWLRTNWLQFQVVGEIQPFFFIWRPESYPGDAAYCFPATFNNMRAIGYRHGSVGFDCTARVES